MSDASTVMFSLDGEQFALASLDEVLNELEKNDGLAVGASYFMAVCENVRPGSFDVAGDILEIINTETYLQAGDAADAGTEGVDQEAKDRLNELVNAWAAEHLDIAYYWKPVMPVMEVLLTADDVALQSGEHELVDLDDFGNPSDLVLFGQIAQSSSVVPAGLAGAAA